MSNMRCIGPSYCCIGPSYFLFIRQSNGPSYPSNGPIQLAIHTTVQWLYWAILLLFHTTMDDQQSLLATLSYVCNPINCSYGIVAKYKVDC